MKKLLLYIGIFFIVITLSIAGYWYLQGMQISTQKIDKVIMKDELFRTERIEIRNAFKPGLEIVIPSIIVSLTLSGLSFYFSGKNKK